MSLSPLFPYKLIAFNRGRRQMLSLPDLMDTVEHLHKNPNIAPVLSKSILIVFCLKQFRFPAIF